MFEAYSQAARWSPREESVLVRAAAFARAAVTYLRQALCGLSGHEMMLHFEPGRLSLRCADCGARTCGWTIDVRSTPRLAPPRASAAPVRVVEWQHQPAPTPPAEPPVTLAKAA